MTAALCAACDLWAGDGTMGAAAAGDAEGGEGVLGIVLGAGTSSASATHCVRSVM